jgi:hypothetical protein
MKDERGRMKFRIAERGFDYPAAIAQPSPGPVAIAPGTDFIMVIEGYVETIYQRIVAQHFGHNRNFSTTAPNNSLHRSAG